MLCFRCHDGDVDVFGGGSGGRRGRRLSLSVLGGGGRSLIDFDSSTPITDVQVHCCTSAAQQRTLDCSNETADDVVVRYYEWEVQLCENSFHIQRHVSFAPPRSAHPPPPHQANRQIGSCGGAIYSTLEIRFCFSL